jgi:hypothetical protein
VLLACQIFHLSMSAHNQIFYIHLFKSLRRGHKLRPEDFHPAKAI